MAKQASSQDKLEDLINLKKGFESSAYPKIIQPIFGFTLIEPGIPLVPVSGGIYMAGWKTWFIKPSDKMLTNAVDYSPSDTSLYVLATSKENKNILVKLSGTSEIRPPKYLKILPDEVYNLKCTSSNIIYILGKQEQYWCIWKYDGMALKLFFRSEKQINQIGLINDDNLVLAVENSIITVGDKHAPKEIIKLDMKVDGVAVGQDGTLFVSTEKGVLHYLSPEYITDADVITYLIHGKLIRYKKKFIRALERE